MHIINSNHKVEACKYIGCSMLIKHFYKQTTLYNLNQRILLINWSLEH
jgi:hypothetical protein